MVCMDGFILTHAVEEVDLPEQDQVDAFVPPFVPRQVLDPDAPVTIGAMVGPEAFTEVRYLAQQRMDAALGTIERVGHDFRQQFGRTAGGLVRGYRTEDADTVLVTIGSVAGAATDVVDELRADGIAAGALTLTCFRPWPAEALRAALDGVRRVVVLERAFSVGRGSIVGQDVRDALHDLPVTVVEAVGGLGGRPVRRADVKRLVEGVHADLLATGRLHFLDLDHALLASAGPQ